MNELKDKVKDKVKNTFVEQKRLYMILLICMGIGFLVGIVYALVLSKSDHTLVAESLNHFFTSIKKNDLHYLNGLANSLVGNVFFVLCLWFFGISIIGMPLIILFLVFQTFLFGFSISSILYTYHAQGILRALAYSFPQQWLFLFIALFLSFYAVSFSKKLFSYLFLKREVPLKQAMKRYSQVLIISLVAVVICSFLEVFLSPIFLRLTLS